jgi:hypothetical protein
MSTPTISNLGQLDAACQRTEQLVQQAAEAERAAFGRWQDAYGAYEVACFPEPGTTRSKATGPPR